MNTEKFWKNMGLNQMSDIFHNDVVYSTPLGLRSVAGCISPGSAGSTGGYSY